VSFIITKTIGFFKMNGVKIERTEKRLRILF
jgi:hypothetical protein